MKMKTGPRVALLAILFVGLGYWAGRGFPRTWQAVLHPQGAPVAVTNTAPGTVSGSGGETVAADTSARVTELEGRVNDLEKTVDELKAPSATRPSEPAPALTPTPSEEPAAPGSTGQREAPLTSDSPFPTDNGAPSGRL